jgi:hypothetical protein
MADRKGFEFRRQFFELVTLDNAWTSDAPLVERLTSLNWREFVERASEVEEQELDVPDVTVMHALIGMAVAHTNPYWSREKTVRFMQRVELDKVEFIGFEEADVEEEAEPADDARPPEMASDPATSPSTSSSAESRSESELLSNGSNPEPSGTRLSDISAAGR